MGGWEAPHMQSLACIQAPSSVKPVRSAVTDLGAVERTCCIRLQCVHACRMLKQCGACAEQCL